MRTGYRIFTSKAKKCRGCKLLYVVYDPKIRKKELHCKLEDIAKINACLDNVKNYKKPDPYLATRHPDAYPFKWCR